MLERHGRPACRPPSRGAQHQRRGHAKGGPDRLLPVEIPPNPATDRVVHDLPPGHPHQATPNELANAKPRTSCKVVFNAPAITVSSKSPKSQRTKAARSRGAKRCTGNAASGDAPGSESPRPQTRRRFLPLQKLKEPRGAPIQACLSMPWVEGKGTPTASTEVG